MFKTASVIIALVLALALFHPNLKGFVVENQVRSVVSGLDVSIDTAEDLRSIADRLNEGYAGRKFTDLERDSIVELRLELRELRKSQKEDGVDEQSELRAKKIAAKFEAILRRHKL